MIGYNVNRIRSLNSSGVRERRPTLDRRYIYRLARTLTSAPDRYVAAAIKYYYYYSSCMCVCVCVSLSGVFYLS